MGAVGGDRRPFHESSWNEKRFKNKLGGPTAFLSKISFLCGEFAGSAVRSQATA
jgi:hypothetical protein